MLREWFDALKNCGSSLPRPVKKWMWFDQVERHLLESA